MKGKLEMSVPTQQLEYESIMKNFNPEVRKMYSAGEDDEIDSIFHTVIRPITWYSKTPCKFINVNGSFTPPAGNDFLLYSYLAGELPAMSIKNEYADRYRIAWSLNIFHEMVEHADCKVSQFELQSFDSIWLAINGEFFLPNGSEYQYDKGIGNVPALQEYSTMLPSAKLRSMQPWFYQEHPGCAFPLYILNSQSTLTHDYTFNLSIDRLLRMQELQDGQWVNIHPDKNVLDLEGIDGTMIKQPELYGCFGKITDTEVTFYKCSDQDKHLYINNVSVCDSINPASVGESVESVLRSEGGLVKSIFWAGLNTSSQDYNIRSNYTTSWDNPQYGDSVVGPITLKYSTGNKLDKVDTDDFAGPLVQKHFPRCPRHEGFYAYPISFSTTGYGIDVGIDVNNLGAKLLTRLKDPEVNRWKNGTHDVRGRDIANQSTSTKDKFTLVVRLLTLRLLVITKDGTCQMKV